MRVFHSSKGVPYVTSQNKGLKPWRDAIKKAAQSAEKTTEPVGPFPAYEAHVLFLLPRPKSHFKKDGKIKLSAPIEHNKKPDLDKLVRAVFDGVTDAELWGDDALVNCVSAKKLYAIDKVGADITIWGTRNVE